MTENAEPFVTATLAPVTDPQAEARCRNLLVSALGHTASLVPPPKGDSLETATRRMEQTAAGLRRSILARRILYAVTVLLILWPGLITPDLIRCSSAVRVPVYGGTLGFSAIHNGLAREPTVLALDRLKRTLPPDEFLRTFGVVDSLDQVTRWQAAWDANPADPVLFNRYATQVFTETRSLPPDFVTTGEKIDPGNGWYRAFASFTLWRHKGGRNAPTETAVRELRTAMAMPRFTSYRDALSDRMTAAIPPAGDYPTLCLNRILITHESTIASVVLTDKALADNLSGVSASDLLPYSNELPSLLIDFLERLAGDSRNSQHLVFVETSPAISNLAGEMRFFLKLDPAVAARWERFRTERIPKTNVPPHSYRRSLAYPVGWVSEPEPLGSDQMRPSGLAARAVIERTSLRTALLITLIGLGGCALCYDRWRKAAAPLAGRLCGLLRPSDHAWILGMGCVLPVSLYLYLTRVHPAALITRGISSRLVGSYQMEAIALGVSMLLLTLEMIRHRMGIRGAVLGFRHRGLNPGGFFILPALGLFFLALPERLPFSGSPVSDMWEPLAWMVPILALSWPFILFWWARSKNPDRMLHRATITRALLPPLSLACLTLTAMIGLSHAEDRYWTRRDDPETPRPGSAGNVTAEQRRSAEVWQRHLLDVLGKR